MSLFEFVVLPFFWVQHFICFIQLLHCKIKTIKSAKCNKSGHSDLISLRKVDWRDLSDIGTSQHYLSTLYYWCGPQQWFQIIMLKLSKLTLTVMSFLIIQTLTHTKILLYKYNNKIYVQKIIYTCIIIQLIPPWRIQNMSNF